MSYFQRPSALALLILAAALNASAQSTSGAIHVTIESGQSHDIEFNARAKTAGAGEGQMNFSGSSAIPDSEETKGSNGLVSLRFHVDVDCLQVSGNRAAMSGRVRDSNVVAYVGQRILLAVEDGGEGARSAADKFTWGIYALRPITWFPTDAELEFDNGWKFSWIATDAERDDDRGVPNTRFTEVDCRSFPLADYEFTEIPPGSGNVQVRP